MAPNHIAARIIPATSCGGVSRAAKGADCKSAGLRLRRFESYLPHHPHFVWHCFAKVFRSICPTCWTKFCSLSALESRHREAIVGCPLCAGSGHRRPIAYRRWLRLQHRRSQLALPSCRGQLHCLKHQDQYCGKTEGNTKSNELPRSQTFSACDPLLRCKPIRNNPAPMTTHIATMMKVV